MPSPFRFDPSWHVRPDPDELWATLAQTNRYRDRWPRREFRVDSERAALTTGAVAHVLIQAPVPYQLRCTIRVDDATTHERPTTRVDGDLTGPARLELHLVAGGTDARMA